MLLLTRFVYECQCNTQLFNCHHCCGVLVSVAHFVVVPYCALFFICCGSCCKCVYICLLFPFCIFVYIRKSVSCCCCCCACYFRFRFLVIVFILVYDRKYPTYVGYNVALANGVCLGLENVEKQANVAVTYLLPMIICFCSLGGYIFSKPYVLK